MTNIIPELRRHNSKNDLEQAPNKLSALWLKIEKHQKRNANRIKKSAEFFETYKQQTLPYEQKQVASIVKQVEHLVTFIARKSLTEMQRDELFNWISSDIDYLDSHPFADNVDTSLLRTQLNSELTKLVDKSDRQIDEEEISQLQDMLDDMFEGELQLDRDELIDILKNPDHMEKHINKFHQRMDEEHSSFSGETEQSGDAFEDDHFYQDYEKAEESIGKHDAKVLEKLFKGSQLNKMYKRLASKLHPDKESDADKKVIKHALMQQLVAARKNKDAFTMLALYHEHIDDDSFNFDAETIVALESLLEQKVSELNYEFKQLKSNNSNEGLIWSHFKGRSNKITAQNIKNHVTQLAVEADKINSFILNTKTVKALQVELSTRIDQRGSFFNFSGSLDDFFDAPF